MATIKEWQQEIDKLNLRECNELIDAFDRLTAWSAMFDYVRDFTELRGMIVVRRSGFAKKAKL